MKTTYLITGAAGHLGGTIIRALAGRDCAVRGLILPSEKAEDTAQTVYYRGDVTEPASLEPLFEGLSGAETVVIHTAGLISIAAEVTPQLRRVNVDGTRNVVEACLAHGVRRLVYVSSVHAIPAAPDRSVITETDHFSRDSVEGAYAKTKAEASQLVLDAVSRGLDAVIVHPSGILGPYDDGRNHMIQLLRSYLLGKLPAGVTGGYDFVDVRDVAEGCLAAAEKGKKGECYILSNRYCTIGGLLDYARVPAHRRRVPCVPAKLAEAFTPLIEWAGRVKKKRPLFTRYALRTLEGNGIFSHDKATMELRYHPRDLKVTVADTIAYLRAKLRKPVKS